VERRVFPENSRDLGLLIGRDAVAVFDTYAQGTPSWVELMTPDQRGAAEFYGALFGWQMVENPLEDGHVYIVGNLHGDAVAGITFQLPEVADHPAYRTRRVPG
jgi:predicted enzyme related to lactoylglutathione lyase